MKLIPEVLIPGVLTENQAWLTNEGYLTNALCFQPMQPLFNFRKGVVKDEIGKPILDEKGKTVLETTLLRSLKKSFKNSLRQEFGKSWRKVFAHPKLLVRLTA